jgi:chromosome segregation ATPase
MSQQSTEHKDRIIAQLRQEAIELRQRERDYKTLQEQLLSLENNFARLNEEKRRIDDDYKARIEGNITFIATLRNEIDDNKTVLTDRKKQNSDLYLELERQKDILDHRSVEIARIRADLHAQQDLNASLQNQKKQLDDDLQLLKERNRDDAIEIDKLAQQVDHKNKESVEYASRIRSIEHEISKALQRIDDLNRILDEKAHALKVKEAALIDAENELHKLRAQQAAYQKELDHLKALDERYRQENADLQRKIDHENVRNSELSRLIQDNEQKIRVREDQIMQLRKELESARYNNSALLDSNANLQAEIDALNNHIRVLQLQNEDLTKELDQFVEANEAIRMRLDRKNRVQEIRNKNEQQLQKSIAQVNDARSPIRQRQ